MALFFAGALALAVQDAGDEAAEIASLLTGGFGVVVSALAVVLAAATILAGVRMRNLRSRWLAILASLVMMLPFFSPCCFLGIPIGIWCLIVLSDRDVKAAFH
ncbi:MAG: hypothetical protein HC882_09670 [Acidobacteria bacterium]|nr:hypothetical protein [Acidobacteriota bacterium]